LRHLPLTKKMVSQTFRHETPCHFSEGASG